MEIKSLKEGLAEEVSCQHRSIVLYISSGHSAGCGILFPAATQKIILSGVKSQYGLEAQSVYISCSNIPNDHTSEAVVYFLDHSIVSGAL